MHVIWSQAMGSTLVNRPGYNTNVCFRPYPFPAGLTPADNAHQRTEAVESGARIPADLPDTLPEALPAENSEPKQAIAPVHKAPAAIKTILHRQAATAIAQVAQRLNTLRQAWLNPPEWTQTVPEVVPLGLTRTASCPSRGSKKNWPSAR